MRRFLVWPLGLLVALVMAILLLLVFPPTGWIAGKIEEIVAARIGYALELGDLELDLLSFTPSTTLSTVSVDGGELPGLLDAGRAEVAVDLRAALTGELVIDRVVVEGVDVQLSRTSDGRTSWTPGPFERSGESDDGGPLDLPTIREVRVADLDIAWSDEMTGTEAALAVQASGPTLPGEPPLNVAVDGTANGTPVRARLDLESPLEDALSGGSVRVALDASMDGAKVALSGSIAEPATLGGLDLALDADVASVASLETVLGTKLPALAPATIDATLRSERDDVVLAANGPAAGEPLQAPLALDLQVPVLEALQGDRPVGVDLAASVGGAKLGVVGKVGNPASLDADVDSLDALEKVLGTELPEPAPATLNASFRSEGEGYVVAADGTVDGELVTAMLNLDSSLDELRAGGPVELELDASISGAKAGLSGRIGNLATLGDVNLALDADVQSLDAVETLLGRKLPVLDAATLSATVKSGADGEGYAVRADGAVDGEPMQASLGLDTSVEGLLAGEPVKLDLDAAVGGATVRASGGVENIRTLAGADLDLDVDVESLAALEKLSGVELPDIEPASLSTTLRTEEDRTVLEAEGTVDGAPVNTTLALESPLEGVLAGEPVTLDLDAAVGGAKLAVSGSIEDPRAMLAGTTVAGCTAPLETTVNGKQRLESDHR